MGTGSHRPQWETAKGRKDNLGGIVHAKKLKSHTKLKFRDGRSLVGNKIVGKDGARETQLRAITLDEGGLDESTNGGKKDAGSLDGGTDRGTSGGTSGGTSANEDSDSELSDSEDLAKELQKIEKPVTLRSWQTDTPFRRPR